MIRIEIRIDPFATPELHDALKRLPPRRRADRLRVLATMGLVGGQPGAVTAVADTGPGPDEATGQPVTQAAVTAVTSNNAVDSDQPVPDLGDLSGIGF